MQSLIAADSNVKPPVFDLVETDSHYLLSIDLPSGAVRAPEIEVRGPELRVTSEPAPGEEPITYFHCLTQGRKLRAVYYQGALWLSLPKQRAHAPSPLAIAV